MSAPAVYTEKMLADFMHGELGKVATLLGYTVGVSDAGSYTEAVNESLLRYGAAAIADAGEILKLRALARVEAWRKACNDLATYYKITTDDGTALERETVYNQALVNLDRALAQAVEWDASGAYVIRLTRLKAVNDPYRYIPDEERTL
jgi:hypothetical protein